MAKSTEMIPSSTTSQDLRSFDKHRALIALELEVLAKRYDRFGWNRDMGTPVQDRLIMDWMRALQEYTLDEVQDACRDAVLKTPNWMPNEGHIKAIIVKSRAGPSWDAVTADQRDLLEQRICPPSMTLADGTANATAVALMATLVRR